ncbi:helix-turn-helix domain-containing protein [Halosimplex litoreum]|uniref:Helix-turn-helix domain-containing protein n=1 Tax=Halosimplex litoreum TaxID=1198301 RepID=A0A7T3KWC1_9EURY|nr:helix-turn-helix domain-containing protein [Halosimplex litoreum]QPV64182.1 helix-turn-helix domain-containing protein [Halosimplex litoreum]
MADAIAEYLQRDLECVDLLECVHGMNGRDTAVFRALTDADGGLTVDAVADRVGCERSTAYRSISRLAEAGFVASEQVNYDHGGYYHVYRPRSSREVADDMRRLLNDWYAQVGRLVGEFDDRYGGPRGETGSVPADSS